MLTTSGLPLLEARGSHLRNRAACVAVQGVARAVQEAIVEAGSEGKPRLQALGCAAYHEVRLSVDIAGLIKTRLGKVDPELPPSDEELATYLGHEHQGSQSSPWCLCCEDKPWRLGHGRGAAP